LFAPDVLYCAVVCHAVVPCFAVQGVGMMLVRNSSCAAAAAAAVVVAAPTAVNSTAAAD
jgi:hypothetical protein